MSNLIFDLEPKSWQDLEALVFQAFDEMGYEVYRNRKISTARGSVRIDVHATNRSVPIPTTILCECKYWNKAVDQNTIYSFRSICSDAGAHYGIIISKKGYQSGAHDTREYTNIHLLDFSEFQSTFFDQWRTGVFMRFVQMYDEVSFLLMGSLPFKADNTLRIKFDGISVFDKYEMFFGEQRYSRFFVERHNFPVKMVDPRGDPRVICKIIVKSPRQYLEMGRQAVRDIGNYFQLDCKPY